jgi:hypothetical protein
LRVRKRATPAVTSNKPMELSRMMPRVDVMNAVEPFEPTDRSGGGAVVLPPVVLLGRPVEEEEDEEEDG